ncbi:MAG: tetratricopeptide repeat protein [Deltaproteobacteria bacterium]|nr:tetratricopeptide repeat protein [Deltaproteobacteria bacterium]
MQRVHTALLFAAALLVACAGNPDKRTLAQLRGVEPDVSEVQIDDGLDQAMLGYRRFLAQTPTSTLTPEAMRRLADLQLEKEYGFTGSPELQAPEKAEARTSAADTTKPAARVAPPAKSALAPQEPTIDAAALAYSDADADLALPGGQALEAAGPLEAIELYDGILAAYPNYEHNDRVLYQKARALDELGRNDEAILVTEELAARFPHSRYLGEVQFRRAEYFFTRKRFLDAEEAYTAVTEMGPGTQYYELALYKLGWTLYKQELHPEALDAYITLLDYKVSIGYDFDQDEDEADERRIADTFRVISLSFSNLGGPDAPADYFSAKGQRSYEDRIYRNLGEFYLEKLRYHDATSAYKAFVGLYPLHSAAPHFSMRVVEIYEEGAFPKLVLESKKEFAASYGVQSEYWVHFDVEESPEVLSYLKVNLEDLANHYHAVYQAEELADERGSNFAEAQHWYGAYLASFSADPEAPGIHYQLADLLLEHEDFGEAARAYEHTAYEYSPHAKSAEAGYAAIFAHREHQKQVPAVEESAIKREAVTSTLRFVDTYPQHEHAAVVLGAAADDLYEMKDLELAIATGQRLIDGYPDADPALRRAAWAAVGHSYFDLADYEQAEHAYAQVLEMMPAESEARQEVVENLAASIYKQGEQASVSGDHRLAADHYLRLGGAAPTSKIRPAAEYDAGAALVQLEDWAGATAVLDAFRQAWPEHELHREATKQIAFLYREQGDLALAAGEYERVAAEAGEPELRREALLVAGELYEESLAYDRALAVYLTYVDEFPAPLEDAVEVRFKLAQLHDKTDDPKRYHAELRRIVEIDRSSGTDRTARIKYLAARSALVLSEKHFDRFAEVKLNQPFEKSLKKKQQRMNDALEGFGALVDYEVAEVTAAATFYMAELYFDFSKALLESERPGDLDPAQMLDYEMVLEEEAFPFEEKAIAVHEKNLELMSNGIYNPWIEKSLSKLAELMPGRYAKFEESSGLIASIHTFAYRTPGAGSLEPEAVEIDEASEVEEPDVEPGPAFEMESVQQERRDDSAAAG